MGRRVRVGSGTQVEAAGARAMEPAASGTNYWIITGSEENMRLGVQHGLWGVKAGQAPVWESVKRDDLLFFYCTRPVSGIVGYGKVAGVGRDTRPFWPNENPQRDSKYPLRIMFERVHEVEDWRRDRRPLVGTGIDFRSGLNYVGPGEKRALLDELRSAYPRLST